MRSNGYHYCSSLLSSTVVRGVGPAHTDATREGPEISSSGLFVSLPLQRLELAQQTFVQLPRTLFLVGSHAREECQLSIAAWFGNNNCRCSCNTFLFVQQEQIDDTNAARVRFPLSVLGCIKRDSSNLCGNGVTTPERARLDGGPKYEAERRTDRHTDASQKFSLSDVSNERSSFHVDCGTAVIALCASTERERHNSVSQRDKKDILERLRNTTWPRGRRGL